MGIKQKKSKIADFQNGGFSKSSILKKFSWKFHGLVLGLVGLIDAKGIDEYGCEAGQHKGKNSLSKNTKNAFFFITEAYVTTFVKGHSPSKIICVC